MQKSWPEERAEIAIWLSGFLGTYKKWVDKILDNDDHEVTKNKINNGNNTLSSQHKRKTNMLFFQK